MIFRRKDDRPWLVLRAARVSGPTGSVNDVELSGPAEEVHRALRTVIRGVGGATFETLVAETEIQPDGFAKEESA